MQKPRIVIFTEDFPDRLALDNIADAIDSLRGEEVTSVLDWDFRDIGECDVLVVSSFTARCEARPGCTHSIDVLKEYSRRLVVLTRGGEPDDFLAMLREKGIVTISAGPSALPREVAAAIYDVSRQLPPR